jgi:hypothetical protein
VAKVDGHHLSPQRPAFAYGAIHVDLWLTKWHCSKFLSELFGFLLSLSFHRGSSYSYMLIILGDEQ